MTNSNTNSRWYQEPLVWLLILIPASAVVGGFITIYLAIRSNDGLVADDYYKQGLEINQTLERDKAAIRHGLQATLQFNIEGQFVRLFLKAQSSYQLPEQIALHFYHRTQAGFDKSVLLERIDESHYRASLPSLLSANWRVQLVADDWRLSKPIQMPQSQTVEIRSLPEKI